MQGLKVALASFLAAIVTAVAAEAQPLSQLDGPRELPPANYGGLQFADSSGCVYVRAGMNGQIVWIPRVDRNRRLVCGFKPTFAEANKVVANVNVARTETRAKTLRSTRPAAPSPQVAPSTHLLSGGEDQTRVNLVYARPIRADLTYCKQPPEFAHRYLLSDGRRVTRCGAGDHDPVGYLNGLGAANLVVSTKPPSKKQVKHAISADAGAYRVVWVRGELRADADHITKPTAITAAQIMPTEAAAGRNLSQARYVQVGAYAEPANSDRAITTLKSLGLTVSTSQGKSGAKTLRLVLAGPFDSPDELGAALRLVRQSGYGDAFARR